MIDNEDEPEDNMSVNQNFPVTSHLNAETSDDVLRNYCDGLKIQQKNDFCLIDLHNIF